jgi:TldD protein
MVAKAQFDTSLVSRAVALALKNGAAYADATLEHSQLEGYSLRDGILEAAASGEDVVLRIRMLKDRYLYSLSMDWPDPDSLPRAFAGVKGFKKQGLTSIDPEPAYKSAYRIPEKESVFDGALLKSFSKEDSEIGKTKYLKFRYGGADYEKTHRYFENSDGSRIESSIPKTSVFYSIVVDAGSNTRQYIFQHGATGGLEGFERSNLSERVKEKARSMKEVMEKGVNFGKKAKNVVIAPEITGIAVHESIGHPFEADRVLGREAAQAGMSYLTKDDMGIRIGSDMVTICDDPTIKGSAGFYLYDDEGVKARKRVLVKNGMQNELLQNRETAGLFGVKSNGSARSSDAGKEPLIRMANTYLEPDKRNTIDDLIEEARNGIYIKSFTEWNIDDTRSFSKYQGNEVYLIENGRLGKPVKNFALETTTMNFWNSVKMIGKEFEFVYGTCGKGEPSQGVPANMGGASALLSFK